MIINPKALLALSSLSATSTTTARAFLPPNRMRGVQGLLVDNNTKTTTPLGAWGFPWQRRNKSEQLAEEKTKESSEEQEQEKVNDLLIQNEALDKISRGGSLAPPSPVSDGKVAVKREPPQCMRDQGRPLIRFVEHGLPTALQTHEMLVDENSNSILATQMEEGRLVKLSFDEKTGEISSRAESAVFELDSLLGGGGQVSSTSTDGEEVPVEDPFVGLHGLSPSEMFPGCFWVTLQYINRVCLVNIETMEVLATVVCPRELPDGNTVGGPHCATEGNGKLFVCMKGGASCHGTTSTRELAEEATAHGLWRVDIDPQTGNAKDEGILFRVPPTPVMCKVDDDGNCWVVTDANGSISKIPGDGRCSGCVQDVIMPYHYALYHQTGPGVQIGPDGNPWFCILNGEGLIGKVDKETMKVTMFEIMSNAWNPTPRIIHINWDFEENILYAISSDLLDKTAVNSLIRIKFDPQYEQIVAQHELALPSQASCIHRIAHIDHVAEPSVLVSELTASQVLQVFKSRLPPIESFPMMTMQLNVRRVYDALKPCPRTGNPVCMCEFEENAIAVPEEPQFEGQEMVFDPEVLAKGEPYINPRTGEKQTLIKDGYLYTNEIISKYPRTGFDVSEIPDDIYALNGGSKRMITKPSATGEKKVGTNVNGGVLKYYPDKLIEILSREPGRIPQMTREIEAAGLTMEQLLEGIQKHQQQQQKQK